MIMPRNPDQAHHVVSAGGEWIGWTIQAPERGRRCLVIVCRSGFASRTIPIPLDCIASVRFDGSIQLAQSRNELEALSSGDCDVLSRSRALCAQSVESGRLRDAGTGHANDRRGAGRAPRDRVG